MINLTLKFYFKVKPKMIMMMTMGHECEKGAVLAGESTERDREGKEY
jgi:hypothetical protein